MSQNTVKLLDKIDMLERANEQQLRLIEKQRCELAAQNRLLQRVRAWFGPVGAETPRYLSGKRHIKREGR